MGVVFDFGILGKILYYYEMENEIWKPVFCAPLYEVSNIGRLRSLDKYILRKDGVKSFMKGKILKVREWDGYKLLNLKLNDGKKITMRVHQIVYHSFNDTFPTRGKVVDHIDGDRSNNKLNNLQFISYTENTVRGKIHTAKKSELPLYIIKQRKVYRIIKCVGGKSKHFGMFSSLEKAIERKEELIKCNWIIEN